MAVFLVVATLVALYVLRNYFARCKKMRKQAVVEYHIDQYQQSLFAQQQGALPVPDLNSQLLQSEEEETPEQSPKTHVNAKDSSL